MTRIVTTFAAGLLAAGCSELPVDTTPAPPGDVRVVCQADTLGWTIGQTADETLVTRAKAEAKARTARVLHPGQMVTMEYNDQRLNLYVDAANKVTRYACS